MALEDVLKAAVVKPAFAGFFDFASDPIHGWTGPGIYAPVGTGDADLDGNTFGSASGILDVSDFGENTSLGDEFRITFSISDDLLDPYTQLIANRASFLGRKAVIWRVFMAADESAVLSYVDRMFTGVMSSASMKRNPDGGGQITIVCDQDLQKARGAPLRWLDHQFFVAGDTASSFINDLTRGAVTASQSPGGAPGPAPQVPGWDYGNWSPP